MLQCKKEFRMKLNVRFYSMTDCASVGFMIFVHQVYINYYIFNRCFNSKSPHCFQEPDTRFTYCQEFHHSMTVVPVNVEALKKAEKAESQARWKTETGWIYPGMKSMLECNEHPQRPNTARIEELQEVPKGREIWGEKLLFNLSPAYNLKNLKITYMYVGKCL